MSDDDHLWKDIISQVEDALLEADILDEETKGAVLEGLAEGLREGLREGLNEALYGTDPNTPTTDTPTTSTPPSWGRPHIEVLPGGRDTNGSDPEDSHTADPRPPEDAPRVPRVLVKTRLHREPHAPRHDMSGSIQLGPEGGIQAILHAQQPRAYRLFCEAGTLRVMAEGKPVSTLLTGQSTDIEAALIQVSAASSARGRYHRLPR